MTFTSVHRYNLNPMNASQTPRLHVCKDGKVIYVPATVSLAVKTFSRPLRSSAASSAAGIGFVAR